MYLHNTVCTEGLTQLLCLKAQVRPSVQTKIMANANNFINVCLIDTSVYDLITQEIRV